MNEIWFVRQRTATSYTLTPRCWQGWALTGAYVAATLAITPLALLDQWLAWSVLLFVETFTFCLVAWRTSAPA